MHILKRKLYKRGSSYELTIPIPILFGIDMKARHKVIFSYKDSNWSVLIDAQPDKKDLARNIYKRGSSYETTIPLQLILHLDPEKEYYALFKYSKHWFLEFEEVKHAK